MSVRVIHIATAPRRQAVKKFYFLEYFYVLLKSATTSSNQERIFEQFVSLKQEHQLGESKYKKLTIDTETSHSRLTRYKYTFDQVLSEAIEYELIINGEGNISLTERGRKVIECYETSGLVEFNHLLFKFMEDKYQAFRYLVETCYNANREKGGLLVFPTYSAYRLGIERDTIKTVGDLKHYFHVLKTRLEQDILKHLNEPVSLDGKNEELISSLIDAGLLTQSEKDTFDAKKYNAILKRGRDFWLKYFLQELYGYDLSLNVFEIWAYRGKQIGILHITEFYPDPNFSGRVVYPLSVIKKSSTASNFQELFSYSDNKRLYLHQPSWDIDSNQEEFVQSLHQAYIDIRQSARTYFVNLSSVRELVCYNMKIPEYLFDDFLSRAYHYHNEDIRIRISLEVDKLPGETNAMFLRREPVMVDNKYRNIIAIDLM